MDKYTHEIFKYLVPDFLKLSQYGFIKEGSIHTYSRDILDGQFILRISVSERGQIDGEIIDKDTSEPYTLFLVESATGSFIGKIRTAYTDVLQNIAENCFRKQVFKCDFTIKTIDYIEKKYADKPEYLWKDYPDCAIWRRKDNRKWYGIIMSIPEKKLLPESNDIAEILDLRADEETFSSMVDNAKVFPGYHMNKKHWITIILNGSVALDVIFDLIDKSYILANKKK